MKKFLSTGVIVMTAVATFTPIVHTLSAGAAGTNTTVVLTFDDDRSDQMTANSLMDARGMVGTFYINSNTVGTSGHMSWSQIQALQASGDEIGGHTLDYPHKDLTKVSTSEATRQACTDRTVSQSHGLTINNFAYPFGAGWDSASVRSIVQSCGYSSARRASGLSSSGNSLHADSSPPADIWAVKTAAMPDNSFSLATLQAMVTSAENSGGGIVTIVFHEAIGNMTAFLDWLQPRAANGTVTRTMTQALNNTTPPPPPPPPSGPYAPTVVADGPAGYWRLGEASGSSAANSAGGAAGTYANVALGAGSLLPADTDTAAMFNGTSSRVQVPSSAALSPTTALSVEAWIKPTSVPAAGAFRAIATKAGSYTLQFNGPKLEFTIVQASGTRRLPAPSNYVAGTTSHVVGTYDGSTMRLYVNGAQVATSARTGAFTGNSSALYIGSANGSSEFFAGTLDEVAVYGSALSASKVTNHYTAGSNATPPSTNQLTVAKGGAGAGTVTSSPAGINCGATCGASFTTGSSITLTAVPAAGSTFGGWSGGGCSGTGTCVVSLAADTSVTASFTPVPTSTLTAAKGGAGAGTVTSSPAGINCGGTCAASFNTGSSVTLTATPAAGSTFGGWSGGGCSGTASCVVSLTADTTVTATFTPVPTSVLTVSNAGAGAGTITSSPAGINCGATCAASFNTGSNVTHTATPNTGTTFSSWSGGGCSGSGTCVVALTADTTVTATYAVAPVSTYQQAVLADAPAGYWRLDEASGTTAANAVSGGSVGTYRGVTLNQAGLLASATDKSVLFNSTTSRVAIPSTTALSPSARVTVEAWIKPTSLPTAGSFASVASKAEAYSLQFNGPQLEFTIIQGSTRRRLQAASGAIAVGGVYHVVGTYDGTTQRLYINGAQVASAALTGAINVNTTALYIGSWDGSQELFKGTIDEVAVYNTALAADRISAHRTAGITP